MNTATTAMKKTTVMIAQTPVRVMSLLEQQVGLRSMKNRRQKHHSAMQQVAQFHSLDTTSSNNDMYKSSTPKTSPKTAERVERQFQRHHGTSSSSSSSTSIPSWPVIQQHDPATRRRFVSSSSSPVSSQMPMTYVTSWLKDVIRTGSLSPPNPILKSLDDARPRSKQQQESSSSTSSAETSLDDKQQLNNRQAMMNLMPWQLDGPTRIASLPKFRHVRPYHLGAAAKEVRQQFQIDLAQLEVKLTSVLPDGDADALGHRDGLDTITDLLLEMERIVAPVVHLQEVAELYKSLAATPDQLQEWNIAINETISSIGDLEIQMYQSKIIYEALHERQRRVIDNGEVLSLNPYTDLRFRQQGVHLISSPNNDSNNKQSDLLSDESEPTNGVNETITSVGQQQEDELDALEKQEHLQQIQNQLQTIYVRLLNVKNYDTASKASRLQAVSDMYNCIGLSQLQAKMLGHPSVVDLSRMAHGHLITATTSGGGDGDDDSNPAPVLPVMESLFDEIGEYLQPFLPHQTKLNLDIVGSFLGDETKKPAGAKSSNGPSEEQQKLYEARYKLKQQLRLHGVIQGICDFCDSIFGLRVELVPQSSSAKSSEGWNKNVRLLHIYRKTKDSSTESEEEFLGTIYLDPFRDNYFRSDDAQELVMTRLLTRNLFQASAPVGVVALKIAPTWDDDPAPMTWDDLREFLYNFGKALQLIFTQNARQTNFGVTGPPDSTEVIAHFMEMWVHNDGFLQRLVQLSHDGKSDLVGLDEETLEILRKDLKKQKALEIMNVIFLSALQLEVFGTFDPRGDETLMALQTRLAEQYLPKGNLPDSSDLSPLLAVFQENGAQNNMSASGPILSELIAAMLYESFQKTDLRDGEQVERLGGGIRDLFLKTDDSSNLLSLDGIQKLCGAELSGGQLKRVYKFDVVEDHTPGTQQ